MTKVFVSGAFDDMRSSQLRFLQEAAKRGEVTALLWSDATIAAITGKAPRFGLAERLYCLKAVRWISGVGVAPELSSLDDLPASLAHLGDPEMVWAVNGAARSVFEQPNATQAEACDRAGIRYLELGTGDMAGFPYAPLPIESPRAPEMRRVVVTGCFDWLHSGHIRFFEEASAYGELTVIVGHDENIRLLKGEGHPLFPDYERQYVVGSIRTVARALISSGSGWLDAEPEISALGAERYVVNEDGDKPEKRRYCEDHGIEYIVLSRIPAAGLPPRTSTDLRGF